MGRSHEGSPAVQAEPRRPYSPPTVSVFGRGIEDTLLDKARAVVQVASAEPGEEVGLDAPELPRALKELGIAVWGSDATRRRGDQDPG